jgi:hypothetical protein
MRRHHAFGILRHSPCEELLQAFDLGNESAKPTHGYPTGYLSAGVFAAVIAGLVAANH